jgi:NADH:ubiquinone oxidoreductase subunit 3 (subunit A)
LSAEIVALLILVGAIVAAVVFTLVIVVAIDPSDANRPSENVGEKDEAR